MLTEHGLEGMAEAIQTLMNAAMKLERGAFLGAGPGERSDERIGHANGFKAKTVKSRVGELPGGCRRRGRCGSSQGRSEAALCVAGGGPVS